MKEYQNNLLVLERIHFRGWSLVSNTLFSWFPKLAFLALKSIIQAQNNFNQEQLNLKLSLKFHVFFSVSTIALLVVQSWSRQVFLRENNPHWWWCINAAPSISLKLQRLIFLGRCIFYAVTDGRGLIIMTAYSVPFEKKCNICLLNFAELLNRFLGVIKNVWMWLVFESDWMFADSGNKLFAVPQQLQHYLMRSVHSTNVWVKLPAIQSLGRTLKWTDASLSAEAASRVLCAVFSAFWIDGTMNHSEAAF